jgi:hypothetical protein
MQRYSVNHSKSARYSYRSSAESVVRFCVAFVGLTIFYEDVLALLTSPNSLSVNPLPGIGAACAELKT